MTDHPSTFRGDDSHRPGIQWDDRASLHLAEGGGGLLDGAKVLRHGTFAEMIRHVMALPPDSRGKYYIEKAGDRQFDANEIAMLARRDDFPAAD